MGRTVRTTATTRSVITTNVPSTSTVVYTNNTGRGAELTAVNINGTGDPSSFATATGGSQWTFFGSAINPFVQAASSSGTGFGHPYPVQLSDNRVLIIFLPHWQHRGGDGPDYFDGDKVHCQILEWQTNKYVAGPITNVQLPVAPYVDTSFSLWSRPNSMSGSWGANNFKAVALTSTKVAVAFRIRNFFRLMRLTITGNTVDQATVNLDLTGASFFNTTTNGAFAIDTVPGDTNKVIIGGFAPTNYSMQAYNIPDSGALTSATVLTSTGIASASLYHFGMSRMVKTPTANVTPYIIAGATSATASTAVIFNFNSSTNVFTVSGLTTSLPAVSSEFSGLECACMSSGTNVNAVIALTGTGAGSTITFCRQTSGAGATNTSTSLTLQHGNTKSINEHFQWGDERVVFVGDSGLLVTYDSAGTSTNLLPTTETTVSDRYQQLWFPFNSRPLYNVSDYGSSFTERTTHWVARTTTGTATSTVPTTGVSVGVSTQVGNYFPFGHDYGIGYAWNEQASCWIVGQGGRLYALDTSGTILSEISIYNLSTSLNWEYAVRQVACTPSGRILFVCEYRLGTFGGGAQNCWNTWSNWSANMFACSTVPLTNGVDLGKINLEFGPSQLSLRHTCNLVAFVEQTNATTRTERAVLFSFDTSSSPQGYLTGWNVNSGWSNIGTTAISTTTGSNSWFRGYRPNFRLIQDTPASLVFPRGLWRIVGSFAINSSANYRQGGISNPSDINSPGGLNPANNQFDNTNTNSFGYAPGYSYYSSGNRASLGVVTMYDQTRGVNRTWSSINGRLSLVRGQFDLTLNAETARRYAQPIATKFGYSVMFQLTDVAAGTGFARVWDTINIYEPRFTLTTGSGNGQIVSFQTGKVSWQHVGSGIDTTYTVGGIPDDVRFFLILDDNAGNTFTVNNGQQLSIVTADAGLFRAEDVYTVPPGWSLRVRADTPRSISTLLTIRENL